SDYKVSNITYDANGNIITLKRTKNSVFSNNEMDNFEYSYNSDNNQLNHILDTSPSPPDADDLETQANNNYIYNDIGQLVTNNQEGITYEYNASGLVTKIKKTTGQSVVEFEYDDKGQRISKQSFTPGGGLLNKSYYIRDINGMPMAIYDDTILKENPIYGSSRVGIHYRLDGTDTYQFSDHLGNVRALMQQDEDENPIIYKEDFNVTTSVTPWISSTFSTLSIEDQRLKCVITRNWHNALLKVNLESGREYQFSYSIDRSSMQGAFSTLLFEPGASSPTFNSGSLESGDYTFTFTANVTGLHNLQLRGWIGTYPNSTDYIQPNTFYIDNIEIKDVTIEAFAHTDYYPFGMPMQNRNVEGDYRYKFQGQEKDPETGMEAFELRLWDGRIGRWLTTDPKREFASPYLGMGNNPIRLTDPDGGSTAEPVDWYKNKETGQILWFDNTASSFSNEQGEWSNVGATLSDVGNYLLLPQNQNFDFSEFSLKRFSGKDGYGNKGGLFAPIVIDANGSLNFSLNVEGAGSSGFERIDGVTEITGVNVSMSLYNGTF